MPHTVDDATDLDTGKSAFSWYDVPPEIKHLLQLAAENWQTPTLADQYIQQALAQAGNLPDVLVSAYRYFFYRHNNALAIACAHQVLDYVRRVEQLPTDWDTLQPLLIARKQEPNIRLFLNAYAAAALIQARLGQVEQAKAMTARISELDKSREFGATTILDVLTQPPEEEE